MRHRVILFIYAAAVAFLPALASAGGVSARAGDRDHLVRVSAQGMERMADMGLRPSSATAYGSFAWVTVTSAELASMRAAGVSCEERVDAYTLRLGGLAFDPLEQAPPQQDGAAEPAAVGAVRLPQGWARRSSGTALSGTTRDLHLIQLLGPTRDAWLAEIEREGVRVVGHLPPFAYIVWGDAAGVEHCAQAAHVRWSGPFLNGYKVPMNARNLNDEVREVGVLLYRGADTDAAVQSLRQLGGTRVTRRQLTDRLELVGVQLSGSMIQDASVISGVISVQAMPTDGGVRSEMSSQVNVNNVDGNNLAFPGYTAWLASVGLSGLGVTIGSVDTGALETHADLAGRFVSCTGENCGGAEKSDHGTRTAGIIAGTGASEILDAGGMLRGLGVAPGAKLVEQLFSPLLLSSTGKVDMIRTLVLESHANGATLSNNSWGTSGTPQGYDMHAMLADMAVRDADPSAPGNQQFTYVLAFMNGKGGVSTQGSPDEAKNILTVGSTKLRMVAAPGAPGRQDLLIDDLSFNTAHGPALDGRTIPHIVAPGCYVDGPVIVGHDQDCGTSFAAPQVAGAVALFIERWRGLPETTSDPSPAMIKAAFLGAAKSLEGHLDADGVLGLPDSIMGPPFDSKQGWGRMDAEAVLDPPNTVQYFDNPMLFDDTGQEWAFDVSPDDPTQPMRLMLVWTDAPGLVIGGDAWSNDLDLVVDADGDRFLGNNIAAGGWSQTDGVADFKNNTEGVFLGPVSPASVTVRVIAADINSDGVPGVGDATDQDFALVCYNCAAQPTFAMAVSPTPVDVCVGSDAEFALSVSSLLGFDEPVTFSVSGEPSGTTATFSVNPLSPPGATQLTIGDTASATAGSYVLAIEGVAASATRVISATLNVFEDVPASVAPAFPAHRTTNVNLFPLFTWDAGADRTTFELEWALDEEFLNGINRVTGITTNSHTTAGQFQPNQTYYWRVTPSNACGEGGRSSVAKFTTRDTSGILLVDDDGNDPDVRPVFEEALGLLSQAFDVRDLATQPEPNMSDLASYDVVIWFTGGNFDLAGVIGPSVAAEATLAAFLDNGNCLLLVSQDYDLNRFDLGFSQDYLGLAVNNDLAGQTVITGRGSAFTGLGPFALTFESGFANFTNEVVPNATAEVAFDGLQSSAASAKDTGEYRSSYWAFPFAAIANVQERMAMMVRFLAWCSAPLQSQNALFIDCLNGPDEPPVPTRTTVDECERLYDADADRDLDLRDYAGLQRILSVTGP